MPLTRRDLLKLLGAGATALAARPVWSAVGDKADDYFVFIHAAGGWDVTLCLDPRNEAKGLIAPASTANTEIGKLALWKDGGVVGGAGGGKGGGKTFEILAPSDSTLRFGPAIGDLYDLRSRLTVFNGIAMNTVSHEDGVTYSLTGRHRSGGAAVASSIDVMVGNELGASQLMPEVAVRFSSHYLGAGLDRRAVPLRVASVGALTESFTRSDRYLRPADRDAISALLTDEATELAGASAAPASYQQLATQEATLPKLLSRELVQSFADGPLRAKYPQFKFGAATGDTGGVSAAFAVEAIQKNLVRCVSFGLGGLDTHGQNYRGHAHTLAELFGVIAAMVKTFDALPHPTKTGAKLGDHVHILVLSDFCRTPQINMGGGRDHYPNNSALVVSPRFKGGKSFGATDDDQLLPAIAGEFSDGKRPVTPADVLATFVGAFGIDPRKHLRDGEIVRAVLS